MGEGERRTKKNQYGIREKEYDSVWVKENGWPQPNGAVTLDETQVVGRM